MNFSTKQYLLTVAAGKRLIAKATAALVPVKEALTGHTIVIVSGSTNGYIAEELLTLIGQRGDFCKDSFLRGVNIAPGRKVERGEYTGTDVVIESGSWVKGKTIFEVGPSLSSDDVIIKGANAVDGERKLAGIQIANPTFGTSAMVMQAVMGRRTQLILPVGLEKRVMGNIAELAARVNSASASGPRLFPVSGTIITELEAISLLTGATADLVAGGGVLGAEGCCWLAVTGTDKQLQTTSEILAPLITEPTFGS